MLISCRTLMSSGHAGTQSPQPLQVLIHLSASADMVTSSRSELSTSDITSSGTASESPENGTVGHTSTQRPQRVQAEKMSSRVWLTKASIVKGFSTSLTV